MKFAIAVGALVLAMAGGAVAATQITGKDVKNGSLTGADVRNKSLTAADFRGGKVGATGPAGAQGAQGAQGPQGPQGATGPAGANGSGVAYARIRYPGATDIAQIVAGSKNVTAASLQPGTGGSITCLDVAAPFTLGVASADGGGTSVTARVLYDVEIGGQFGCPVGTDAAVQTQIAANSSAITANFSVIFS